MNRDLLDRLSAKAFALIAYSACALTLLMAAALVSRSWLILSSKPLGQLLFSSNWHPMEEQFGFLPFIVGTIWVTGIAMAIAIPVSILTAIFLSEYAPPRIRGIMSAVIDLLAGIPSVVFGVWGVVMIVPFVKDLLAPVFGITTSGYCVISAALVLGIMVLPFLISIITEVFKAVPADIKNASLSVGASKWQTIKHVVLRRSVSGIVAAVILGFSRAFGETMAVLMLAGNVPISPHSIFDPAYPLPALIANNYGEMMSIPMYDSALLFAALILLFIVLIFNVLSRYVLLRAGVER